MFDPPGRPLFKLPGANRRWRGQFRYRGSRRESAVAQLFSLGIKIGLKLELVGLAGEDLSSSDLDEKVAAS